MLCSIKPLDYTAKGYCVQSRRVRNFGSDFKGNSQSDPILVKGAFCLAVGAILLLSNLGVISLLVKSRRKRMTPDEVKTNAECDFLKIKFQCSLRFLLVLEMQMLLSDNTTQALLLSSGDKMGSCACPDKEG